MLEADKIMKPLIVLALIVLCENTLVFAFPSRESSKETGNEIEQEFKYFKPSDLGKKNYICILALTYLRKTKLEFLRIGLNS